MRKNPKTLVLILVLFYGYEGWVSPVSGQTITIVAGNGTSAYTGDGGPALAASLDCPDDVAFDSFGNYYIADACSNTVRRVDIATGIITTYAGLYNPNELPGAGDGGPATQALLNFPSGLAFDSGNNLYIADYYDAVIREVTPPGPGIATGPAGGTITTFAGTLLTYGYSGDGGPASQALMTFANIVRFDPTRHFLYVTDAGNSTLRVINMATGIITTVAGNGISGYSGDGGPAVQAEMDQPEAIAFDGLGDVVVSDCLNARVREVDPAGIINTIVGSGTPGFSGDGGPATLAELGQDIGSVTFMCDGDMILTDDGNNRVRMVSKATGIINTVIGTGIAGLSPASGPLLGVDLGHPEALALDNSGTLYLVDYDYSLVQVATGVCPTTPTPTPSPTSSPTPTRTPTPTDSPTPTSSPTPSPSPTETSTPTPTPSPTPTSSPTHTDTPTPSYTPTSTPTFTVTYTPTWNISMGKQVSQTTAQAGTTLTYTLGVTVVSAQPPGLVVSDPLPAGISFVGFLGNPSGSATFLSGQSSILWTLPSPLSPGIYGLNYQTLVNPLTPGGTNLVNSASLTYTGIPAPLSSSVTVQVQGSSTVVVGVYNSAGELVDSLLNEQLSGPVNAVTLSETVLSALSGPNGQVDLYVPAGLLASWNGTNAQGVPVSNGVYIIQIENVSSTGAVSSIIRQVTVSRGLAEASAAVYNSAGEIVKHLYSQVTAPTGSEMTNVELSSNVLCPGCSPSGQAVVLNVEVVTSQSPITLLWDGNGDSGGPVSPGHYILQVRWADGQGGQTDISRDILVAPGDGDTVTVSAIPNVITGGGSTVFTAVPAGHLTLRVRIYTIAGELVTVLQGLPGTNQVDWNASRAASGLYLAAVDLMDPNGLKGRQTLKVTVLH